MRGIQNRMNMRGGAALMPYYFNSLNIQRTFKGHEKFQAGYVLSFSS